MTIHSNGNGHPSRLQLSWLLLRSAFSSLVELAMCLELLGANPCIADRFALSVPLPLAAAGSFDPAANRR